MILGQASAGNEIDVFLVVVTLLGGLAIFLLGLDRLTESLRIVAGDRMRGLLRRLTGNRFKGLATGTGVTAIIQSSSVTTVLVVGFIASGVMTFGQSLGVIMGANIGTTVTTQIIAFDVGRYSLALVAVGFGISFFSKRDLRSAQGTMIMGLGSGVLRHEPDGRCHATPPRRDRLHRLDEPHGGPTPRPAGRCRSSPPWCRRLQPPPAS